MGIIDSVEIVQVTATPPAVLLRLHRLQSDAAIALDAESLNSFVAALAKSDTQTYWLRSASFTERPVLFWWRMRGSYKALVRVKRGAARTELAIPCSRTVYESLLSALKSEWAAA